MPKWMKSLGLAGWIIVISGVAGEGLAEAFVANADTLLQQSANDLLAEASERASAANLEAANARKNASSANALAEQYQSGIAASNA